MTPLVFRAPPATALFFATALLWMITELRIMVRNRGGEGENLDMGSRVWVVLLITAGMGAALGLAWLDVARIAAWPALIAGVALALAGILLRQWAVLTLGAFFTTAVEVQRDHRVIESGPYAWVRHPSYLGSLLSLAGMSLALGSWLGIIVASLLGLAGVLQRIAVEECALASRLGPAWAAFAGRRKRLIPFVW